MVEKGVHSPCNDCNDGLQPPAVDISDHADLPKEIWAEEIVPQELPDDRRSPEAMMSAGTGWHDRLDLPFPSTTAQAGGGVVRDNAICIKFTGDIVDHHRHGELSGRRLTSLTRLQ